jgi:hypothetical protein
MPPSPRSSSASVDATRQDAGKAKPAVDASVTEQAQFTYSDDEARQLLKKIDWRIMPFLWGYAVLSAVDVSFERRNYAYQLLTTLAYTLHQKTIISNAALYGMTDDDHLVGQQYSWGRHLPHHVWLLWANDAGSRLNLLFRLSRRGISICQHHPSVSYWQDSGVPRHGMVMHDDSDGRNLQRRWSTDSTFLHGHV